MGWAGEMTGLLEHSLLLWGIHEIWQPLSGLKEFGIIQQLPPINFCECFLPSLKIQMDMFGISFDISLRRTLV